MTPEAAQPAPQPILLVEDDFQLRHTIAALLQEEGFAVTTAADGREAVERVTTQRPALVLLDWGLPLLSGAEVAEVINTTYHGDVPILLITADGRSAEKARQVGARDYLNKPFEVDTLLTTIDRILASPSSSP